MNENTFAKPILQALVNAPIWEESKTYMKWLGTLATSTESFLTAMPTSELLGKFRPFMDKMEGTFAQFNGWLQSFFTDKQLGSGDIVTILEPSGEAGIFQALSTITDVASKFANFVTSPNICQRSVKTSQE